MIGERASVPSAGSFEGADDSRIRSSQHPRRVSTRLPGHVPLDLECQER
jgi:hypothetical protein